MTQKSAEQSARGAARLNKLKTHCRNGHSLSGDNLYIRPNGERQCIACRRASARRAQKNGLPSEQALRKLFDGLRAGLALQTLILGKGPGGFKHSDKRVISGMRLANLRRINPRIDAKIKSLIEKNKPLYSQRISTGRRTIAAPFVLRNDGADAFAAIMAATASLPDHLRDDVRGTMFVAVSEGRLKPNDIGRRVREYVTCHNRMFSQFVPNGGGIMRSLDQQLFDDGPMTLGDTVTQGLWQ